MKKLNSKEISAICNILVEKIQDKRDKFRDSDAYTELLILRFGGDKNYKEFIKIRNEINNLLEKQESISNEISKQFELLSSTFPSIKYIYKSSRWEEQVLEGLLRKDIDKMFPGRYQIEQDIILENLNGASTNMIEVLLTKYGIKE